MDDPLPRPKRPYMPGYGLKAPEASSGLLPWSWAEQQLNVSRNFWLATRWPDDRPHVMPVWAVWHAGALWFSSSNGSRKARNLALDGRCVLTTEDAANPVIVECVAERLSQETDLREFLDIVNAKYGTHYGAEIVDPAANSSYRARPVWAFGLRADDFTGSPTRWSFV
jgi:pyridoxamine 5'-phosphate oxidase-like protein